MADELWNQKLTRENIRDFYMSTVVMVYSSCYGITKEATRCENAIVKSYLDIYSKRNNVPADKVIYEFGDILLENSKNIVAQYPLPADMTFEDRLLDEYTRNTDVKKAGRPRQMRKLNDLFQITPLLIFEIIILAIVIWGVSFIAITLPYRHSELINEKGIFETASVQEQFIAALPFYPITVQVNKSTEEGFMPAPVSESEYVEPSAESQTETEDDGRPHAQVGETTEPEVSATSG